MTEHTARRYNDGKVLSGVQPEALDPRGEGPDR